MDGVAGVDWPGAQGRRVSPVSGWRKLVVQPENPLFFLAEVLVNFSPQMRVFDCNREASNANKTNENRSVQTGQVELANRCLEPLGPSP